MWKFIVYSLRIRRVEYRIAELPIFFIPVLLTITDWSDLLGAVMWEGLTTFLFLFAFGDLLNCLSDRHLDAVYKPQLTQAVYGIGIRGVIIQAGLSAFAAVGLTVHIAIQTGRWILVPMVLMGLVIAWAYSIEPVRLKRRGLWQLLFYWLGLFVAPMIFAACLFSDAPSSTVIAVCVAFASVQTGIILVNTAEDYPEDSAMNVRTAIVALGIRGGVFLACCLTIVGSVLLIGSFLWIAFHADSSRLRVAVLLPQWVATSYCAVCIVRLNASIRESPSNKLTMASVRKAGKQVPVWMSTVAVSSWIASAAFSPAFVSPR